MLLWEELIWVWFEKSLVCALKIGTVVVCVSGCCEGCCLCFCVSSGPLVRYDTSLADASKALAERWISLTESEVSEGWVRDQRWYVFTY